tara:strand:- start:255 stop:878 length:624 start_codon:yes stop_codon:yes gene_type:complete
MNNSNIKIFEDDLPSDIDLSKEKKIGLDCEALGVQIPRDPLTLVQLGLQSKICYIIKLNRKTYSAPNLTKVLQSTNTEFIMHWAPQDLKWLKYYLKVSPKNIFCTKICSRIIRTASNAHGYKDLVKEFCGKDISKKEQTSDWGGSLTSKQIEYAARDTEFLFEIRNKLEKMLEREPNRKKLFYKAMTVLPIIVDMELAGYKLQIFEY